MRESRKEVIKKRNSSRRKKEKMKEKRYNGINEMK